MNHLKVKDQDHLYRDVNTGAIINTDRSSFAKYKASRNKQRSMEHELDYVKGELKLYDLTIIKGSFFDNRISLRVKPLSNDIKALREMYLDVDIANSSFVAYKE